MKASGPPPANIDEYIDTFPPKIQIILEKIRKIARKSAPDAEEVISYRMPALKQNGIVIYFAAFKKHIGLYPPVKGDPAIEKAIAPYAGPGRNLQFPLDQPIPYELIGKIVKLRVKQNLAKVAEKGKKKV